MVVCQLESHNRFSFLNDFVAFSFFFFLFRCLMMTTSRTLICRPQPGRMTVPCVHLHLLHSLSFCFSSILSSLQPRCAFPVISFLICTCLISAFTEETSKSQSWVCADLTYARIFQNHGVVSWDD